MRQVFTRIILPEVEKYYRMLYHWSAERRMSMPRSIRELFGERVVLLRRRKGLSQPALASQAGMSVTTLNRVENAHQSLYMEKVATLATALGTTADYLLGLTDDIEPVPAPPKRPRSRTAAPVG
jgi:ribosome-binding protein aMBF1 (putative translation factor)